MSGVKHTGWKADCGFHRHDPKMTCSVRITSGTVQVKTEDEARLIAAAPDLFEAASAIAPYLGATDKNDWRGLDDDDAISMPVKIRVGDLRALKAALSKATTQQEGR